VESLSPGQGPNFSIATKAALLLIVLAMLFKMVLERAACPSMGASAEDRLHLLRRQMKRLRVEKEVLTEELATYHKKERTYMLTRRQLDLATERVEVLQRGAAHTDAHEAHQAARTAAEAERADRLAAQLAGWVLSPLCSFRLQVNGGLAAIVRTHGTGECRV
jgi:hypothetical protein